MDSTLFAVMWAFAGFVALVASISLAWIFISTHQKDCLKFLNVAACSSLLSEGLTMHLAVFATFLIDADVYLALFLISFVVFGYFVHNSTKTKTRVWGIACIVLSVESFLMPVSALIAMPFAVSEVIPEEAGFEAIGAFIGGGIVLAYAAIVGVLLGIVFLIIGVFLLWTDSNRLKHRHRSPRVADN